MLEYRDYWFNYVLKEDPETIKKAIKEEFISSDGKKIHLDVYDKEGLEKTIIFVHGTAVYSRFYAEFCYALFKKGFRVIAPDLIGHGLSEGKRGHFTMEQFTKTVYDVTTYTIEKYGDKIAVMGSSLGGITSLYCAARDTRLKGAICHNAAIFNENAYKRIIKQKWLKIVLAMIPFLAKIAPKMSFSVYLYLDFTKLANSGFMDRIEALIKDELLSYKYTTTGLRAQMREPMARSIESIDTPIMIINGDEDNLFSVDYIQEIYDRLTCKDKKLEILKGASHLIFQEYIEEALDRVIPWLEKVI